MIEHAAGRKVNLYRVMAHAEAEDIVRMLISEDDFVGNAHADAFARRGADSIQIPDEILKPMLEVDKRRGVCKGESSPRTPLPSSTRRPHESRQKARKM